LSSICAHNLHNLQDVLGGASSIRKILLITIQQRPD